MESAIPPGGATKYTRAMYAHTLSPASVKLPPAYSSLSDTASALTEGVSSSTLPIPDPRADQLPPFHLAIPLARRPSAMLKVPAAYRSLPETASANTMGVPTSFLRRPDPSCHQLLPFH